MAQDVFLRVYRNRTRYRPRARLATWLFHIAGNVGRNALRTRRRRPLTPVGLPGGPDGFAPFAGLADDAPPARPLERAEVVAAVRRAVGRLARRQRRALELHIQNRSHAEIAADLAVTPKAAKSLLYRARLELRGDLEPFSDA